MEVTVNGVACPLPDDATVADVAVAVGASLRGCAVAVDGVVVPRAEWTSRAVRPDAQVEVVHAVQGG
jgi:sulfur carrier protein